MRRPLNNLAAMQEIILKQTNRHNEKGERINEMEEFLEELPKVLIRRCISLYYEARGIVFVLSKSALNRCSELVLKTDIRRILLGRFDSGNCKISGLILQTF